MKLIYKYIHPAMVGILPTALFDYSLDTLEWWVMVICLNATTAIHMAANKQVLNESKSQKD